MPQDMLNLLGCLPPKDLAKPLGAVAGPPVRRIFVAAAMNCAAMEDFGRGHSGGAT